MIPLPQMIMCTSDGHLHRTRKEVEMKKKVKLWCGLSAVSAALLVLMAMATDYAFGYAEKIGYTITGIAEK